MTISNKAKKEAIERQQYTPKAVPSVCGNCKHFTFDMELPVWMQKQPGVWDEKYKQQANLRCGIGGFPVKKMGSCNEYEREVAP